MSWSRVSVQLHSYMIYWSALIDFNSTTYLKWTHFIGVLEW